MASWAYGLRFGRAGDVHSGSLPLGRSPFFVFAVVCSSLARALHRAVSRAAVARTAAVRTAGRCAVALGAAAAMAGCGPADAPVGRSPLVDDFGDTLRLVQPAQRVVSLNPVTTELMFALDAGDRLVGRTTWDLAPEAAKAVPDVGAGIGPNVEAVLGQRPDLVLLYANEANRLAAQRLRAAGVQTLSHRTDRIADLPRAIAAVAAAIGRDSTGRFVADTVRASLARVAALPRPARATRAFWFIWDPPLLTIGGGSYLSELLEVAGAENAFGDLTAPSPQVSLEEIARRDPDVILAGPTNAARIRRDPKWQAVPAVRAGRIIVLDTTIVGRPGVRMGEAAQFIRARVVDAPR